MIFPFPIFNKKRSSEKHSDSSDKANSQLLTAMIFMTEYFILADSAPSRARGHCQYGEFLTDYGTRVLLPEGNCGHVFKTTTAPTFPV